MLEETTESFIEQICGDSHLRIEDDFGDGFVRLKTSEAERRQAAHDIRSTEDIVIEMLRNARDAEARHIFVALAREGETRSVVMLDDGSGIPVSMHVKIFDSRVTSKLDTMHIDKWGVHGRGMALYSIAVNADRSEVLVSDKGKGSAIRVITNLAKVGERKDQSTFPLFDIGQSGSVSVRGPRNIVRTCCEFALESRKQCEVYVGSFTEIAATLHRFGFLHLSAAERMQTPADEVGVCCRLSLFESPNELAEQCEFLGLSMSQRSARRILDGEILPVPSLLDRIAVCLQNPFDSKEGDSSREADLPQMPSLVEPSAGRIRFNDGDIGSFCAKVREAYADLARSYYLADETDIEAKVSKGFLCLKIPLERLS